MLLAERGRYPDDCLRFGASCVGDELPEMVVVGRRELVLDDQHAVVREVAPEEVERERSDRVLGNRQLEIDAEHVGEDVGVLEQPGREIVSLMHPHLT